MTGEVVLGLLLKGSLVLGAGAGAAFSLRRSSAAVRHAVLVTAIAGAAALPALTLLLPSWTVPLFERTTAAPAPALPSAGALAGPLDAAASAAPVDFGGEAATMPGPSRPPGDRDARFPPLGGLLALWAVGALLILARFAVAVARTAALVREAVPATGAPAARAAEIARRLGVRRPVRLVVSARLPVPATWGLVRPVVALPVEALEWQAGRMRAVLLHELAHVRRWDGLSVALAEVATALWWFHPLAWLCQQRLRIERERACDDVVLTAGTRPESYASLLVELARASRDVPRPALAMARPSTLRDRVETILAAGRPRRALGRRVAVAGAVAAVAIVLPLASVHLWGETMEARETTRRIAELDDPDPRIREAAAWTLGARRSERAIVPLLGRLDDPDARVRGMAARSLGKIGDPRAAGGLAKVLQDPDPRVRELALLGLVDHRGTATVALVEPLLDDPAMGVRSVAVHVLSELGGERAVQALGRAARSDPDPHTRSMAISGIGYAAGGRSGLPTLMDLLADPDPGLRVGAAKALTALGDPRAVEALVTRAGAEPDAEVRGRIVEALAAFPEDGRAVEGLVAALGDEHFAIRVAAAEALGHTRDARAVPALLAALHDPVHQVRLMADWSLEEIERRTEAP